MSRHLEDDVHSASARRALDSVQVTGVAMAQYDVRSLRANQFEAFVAAAGTDDAHAVRARHLDGGDADTSGRAVDENRFGRPRCRALKERAARRGVRDTERRALRERYARRQRMNLV